MNKLILQYPFLKYPILIFLIGTFLFIELYTFNYRQKGILRDKGKGKSHKEVQVGKAKDSLYKSGPTLFLLAALYSLLTCSILSVLYANRFYTLLATWVHVSIMIFCFVFFCLGIVIASKECFIAARSMLSLLLSPWLVLFFVAGYPLFRKGIVIQAS